MNKKITAALIAIFAVGLTTAPAWAQEASDVLAKMIEATGGRKALAAIKDSTITGEFDMVQMGMSGTVTIYQKEPNKTRQDMEVMGMMITQAFDGEVAWFTNPQTGAVEELTGSALEYSKKGAVEMGNEVLLNPEKFGVTYTLKGKETIEGKEYFVLERMFESGATTTMWVDTGNYLVYKQNQITTDGMGGEIEQELIFSDYQKVDGILYPMTLTIYQGGEEFLNITMTELTFNSGLEDSFFKIER